MTMLLSCLAKWLSVHLRTKWLWVQITLLSLCKKCFAIPFSFLVIDTTFTSDNPLRFRCNLLEIILKLIMTIDDKIRDENMQFDTNKEA